MKAAQTPTTGLSTHDNALGRMAASNGTEEWAEVMYSIILGREMFLNKASMVCDGSSGTQDHLMPSAVYLGQQSQQE